MNTATVIKSPQERITEIQNYDRNILVESLLTSPQDIKITIDFLESQKTLPGANVEQLSNLISDCMNIMIEKIKLTKTVLGINGNYATIIPNPQIEIPFQNSEVKESENKQDSPEQIMAKTEKKEGSDKSSRNNVINFNEAKQKLEEKNKKNKNSDKSSSKQEDKKETKAISFQGFTGYTRKVVFGTDEAIPESVFALVPLAQTESEIDNISRHLIEEGQVELALNLAIDLFEKSKTAPKLQQEVEKRFLNEIMPWTYGVTVKPFEDFQNVSLAFWNKHLIDIANANKLITKLTTDAIEEMKTGEISMETANAINTQLPNEAINIFGKVASELKIPGVKFATKPREKKETVANQPIDIAPIKAKLIADLTKNGKIDGLLRPFREQLMHLNVNEVRVIWNECLDTWKASVQTAAEQGAETTEQVVNLTKDQAKEEVKSIIKKAIEAGENVKNKFQQIIHKKDFRTALGVTKDNVNKIFEEAKSEVIKDNPDLQKKNEDKPRKMVLSNFKVEEMFPTVYESAKNCKTLGEFKDLLINIVFEQKKFPYELKGKTKEMDGWQVAANLVNQYANNFEGSKDWDADTKTGWFNGLIGAVTEQRRKAAELAKKEAAKDAIVEDAVIVEESAEQGNVQDSVEQNSTTSETEDSTPKVEPTESTKQEEVELARSEQSSETVDMKKFDGIMQLSDRNKIDTLITEFLLLTSYKTYQERFNELRDKYLKGNKKWSGSKPEQRENTINKIVKNNPEIQKLTK